MKKFIALILSMVLLAGCCSLVASAEAYVTDGNNFYLAGDANGDNTVDICDLVAAHNGSGNTVVADLDGDGEVGSYDLALIRAMILGIDKSQWS